MKLKAGLVALFAVTLLAGAPVLAQTSVPASDKPETGCTPSAAVGSGRAIESGQTTGSTANPEANSAAVDKSAVLPSAGQHASSAAPTVQRNGEPMQVRPGCPPDESG